MLITQQDNYSKVIVFFSFAEGIASCNKEDQTFSFYPLGPHVAVILLCFVCLAQK